MWLILCVWRKYLSSDGEISRHGIQVNPKNIHHPVTSILPDSGMVIYIIIADLKIKCGLNAKLKIKCGLNADLKIKCRLNADLKIKCGLNGDHFSSADFHCIL